MSRVVPRDWPAPPGCSLSSPRSPREALTHRRNCVVAERTSQESAACGCQMAAHGLPTLQSPLAKWPVTAAPSNGGPARETGTVGDGGRRACVPLVAVSGMTMRAHVFFTSHPPPFHDRLAELAARQRRRASFFRFFLFLSLSFFFSLPFFRPFYRKRQILRGHYGPSRINGRERESENASDA